MIIQEKIRALAVADADVLAAIGARMFVSEAPPNCTLPYVIFMMSEEMLPTHNNLLETTRRWKGYFYPHGANPLESNRVANWLKSALCLYKQTATGIADTTVIAITLEEGIKDLERNPNTKAYPCSLVMDIWEQLT